MINVKWNCEIHFWQLINILFSKISFLIEKINKLIFRKKNHLTFFFKNTPFHLTHLTFLKKHTFSSDLSDFFEKTYLFIWLIWLRGNHALIYYLAVVEIKWINDQISGKVYDFNKVQLEMILLFVYTLYVLNKYIYILRIPCLHTIMPV